MKTLYYYASHIPTKIGPYPEPKSEAEMLQLCTCAMTDGLLHYVISQQASGKLPFTATFPADTLHRLSNIYSPSVVQLRSRPAKKNCDPTDFVEIVFEDSTAFIHFIRLMPYVL